MKLRSSTKFLYFIWSCFPALSQAQGTNPYGEVTIASPNAASLGKYADIPVSYHTGIPQINIPLYDIKAGPISIPIGLSYHASGLKVSETASWVGAGWSLDAGGVVTRTVMGQPDEKNTGLGQIDIFGYYTDSGYNKYLYQGNLEDWQGFAQNRKDGEPDLFFFNFGGYSGKFFFRDDHTPVLVPQQDVKIIPNFPNPGTASIQGFTIITPDGTKYYFGNTPGVTGTPPIEITSPYSAEGGFAGGTAISSWYLNKVTSMDSLFSVVLTYVPETYGYYVVSSTPWDPNSPNTYHELNFVKNLVNGVRLSQITFPNGSVTFNPGLYRKDLSDYSQNTSDYTNYSATALSSITIQNNNTVSNTKNAFCKNFKFFTSYFTDSTTVQPAVFTTAGLNFSTDRYRLRLDSIREMSCDNLLQIPARRFTYFSELTPRRMNLGTDHWGFYNGVTSNQTMYPTYTTNDGTTITTFPGANRNAAWPAMRGGSLYQMTYPTGGTTTFDFEPADSYSLTSSVQQNGQIGSNYVLNTYGQNVFTQTSPFTSNGNSVTLNATNYSNYAGTFTIYNNIVTNIYSTSVPNNNYPGSQTSTIIVPTSIPAGNYTATFSLSTSATNGATAYLSQILTITTTTPVVIGGLRIKTITQKDSINATAPIITSYTYPNGGFLYSFPTYVSHLRNDLVTQLGYYDYIQNAFVQGYGSNSGCPLSGGYYVRSGNSQRPMSTTQGYHIGFPVVKVSQSGNGYSLYNYYTSNSGYGQQSLNPSVQNVNTALLTCEANTPNYPPAPQPFDSKKGELYYEQHFNQAGQLLKDVYYYPQFDTSSLQPAPAFIVQSRTNTGGSQILFGTVYKVSSPRKTSMHTVETNYTPGIGNVQQDTYIYYGSPYHNQVTRKVVTTSNGDSMVTKTLYSSDFHSASWDVSPSPEATLTTNNATCQTAYNNAGGGSAAFLVYRQCISNARNTYVNSRFTNYTGTPSNTYKTKHDSLKNVAGTELKPILDLQDSGRVVPIEISDYRDGSLLKANFTRYDYSTSST